MSKIIDAAMTPLAAAHLITNAIHDVKTNNLAEYTKKCRVVSKCILDNKLLNLDPKVLRSILQTELSLYAGFYLTAVNMTAQVGNVSVMRLLDKFSTDSDVLSAVGNSVWWQSMEGYEYIDPDSIKLPNYSSESFDDDDDEMLKFKGSSKPYDNKDTIQKINDESNLVVGKILDVKIVSGDQSVTIPIQIMLSPISMASNDIVTSASFNSSDKTMVGRWRQWRSGEISFFKDYLLALDQVEANRKGLVADKTGVLTAIQSQRSKGILATLLRGYAAPNAVSAMLNISKDTSKQLEYTLRGKLTDFTTRKRYFEGNSLMSLIVIDPQMERFTVFQRGISEYGTYTFDDVKNNSTKTTGTDIESILKAYSAGHAAILS